MITMTFINEINIRRAGVIAGFLGCIFFFVGGVTEHWAKSNNAYYGLWYFCGNLTHLNSSNSTNSTWTTTSAHPSVSNFEQDEEECEPFAIPDIPGLFHLVRTFIVLGGIGIGYSVFGRLRVNPNFDKGNNFTSIHRGEICCIIAASMGILATEIFITSFKSYEFEVERFHHLDEFDVDWSLVLARLGCIILICGALFLMLPTLKYKCWDRRRRDCSLPCNSNLFSCCDLDLCSACQQKQENEAPPRHNEIELALEGLPTDGSLTDDMSAYGETTSNVFTVEVDNRSRSSHNRTPPLNPESSYHDPAPRYEDLSPREQEAIPPPPSYDEVITGQYYTRGSTSSSGTNNPLPPSCPPASLMPVTLDSREQPPGYHDYASYV